MIPHRAFKHLPLCPACALGFGLAGLGVMLAVGRTAALVFGVAG